MKKTLALVSALLLGGVAFSQIESDIDYVEIGVNENQPENTVLHAVQMPDGSTKTLQIKRRHFNPDNLEAASSQGTARTTEELLKLIDNKRKYDEFVKEMYEEDGVFYILFHQGDSKRRTPEISK